MHHNNSFYFSILDKILIDNTSVSVFTFSGMVFAQSVFNDHSSLEIRCMSKETEKKKILIVDDEEDLTWSISKGLSRDGETLEVYCVNSGSTALEMLQKDHFDLMVTDIRMPGVSGLRLLKEVKDHHPSTKVILMTAYGSMEIKEALVQSGMQAYIEKPFEFNELRNLIYRCLGNGNGRKTTGSVAPINQ